MACLGEMGEEGQQQGRPSVISSVLCRGNHGASPARVAMRTDQMEGAGGTLNLPSLPPPRRTLACALARTWQKEVPGSRSWQKASGQVWAWLRNPAGHCDT